MADTGDGTDCYECDLPGCEQTANYEPDEEDYWPPEPPLGWFSVLVARHESQQVMLMFCSQEHLGAGVGSHLPDAVPVVHESSDWRGDLVAVTLLLSVLGVLVLGLFSAVGLVVDFFGWLGDR